MPANPNTERFLRRLARIERELRHVSTQPQLGDSSVEGGAILFNTEEGDPAMQVGYQFDGTNAPTVLTGPPPPQPTAPAATPVLNGAVVNWDGLFVDDALVPMDFARVEVHASDDPDDLAETADTLVGTYETPRGGNMVVPVGSGTQYVRLVARSLSGARSTASDAVSVVATTSDDITAAVEAIASDALDIANAAASDASGAVTTANGKGKVYYSATEPTGGTYSTSDLWFDQSTDVDGTHPKNTPNQWDGTDWVPVPIGGSAISFLDIGKATVGTLGVARLGARTITTDKMAIGSFDNLIPDPTFDTAYGVVAWPTTSGWAINATGSRGGGRSLQTTNTGSDQDIYPNPQDVVKCVEGDSFALQWWAKSSATNTGSVQMLARFKDTSGATTIYVVGDDQDGVAGTYTEYNGQVTAPPDTVSVSFGMRSAAALSTGTIDWDYVSATRAGTGKLIVDGSIEGRHLLADTITSREVSTEFFSASFTLTGSLTVADPSSTGPGITITPATGITIPQPDGGLIQFPADGSAAQITADIVALSLNVKDALVISGTGQINGQVSMANGIVAPLIGPAVSYEWPSRSSPPSVTA